MRFPASSYWSVIVPYGWELTDQVTLSIRLRTSYDIVTEVVPESRHFKARGDAGSEVPYSRVMSPRRPTGVRRGGGPGRSLLRRGIPAGGGASLRPILDESNHSVKGIPRARGMLSYMKLLLATVFVQLTKLLAGAHASAIAGRRGCARDLAGLCGQIERQELEIDLLRARLPRLDSARRPR